MTEEEFPKNYEAAKYEDQIYKAWEESGYFEAEVDESKEPFVISMPPPNATGKLHVGHAAMLALQDIMIRYNRMLGKSSLWLPGTDHAAIATQNKVEQLIEKEGTDRHALGREKFIERVKEYVAESQNNIRNQMRKMGASCDWKREAYTFSDDLNKAVNAMFIKMYEDDLIYRGDRIVNWCPRCHSTLSDDEVEHKEGKGKLYWIKYGPFTLATTRLETKLGDTAVAVHPDDDRYKSMIGKTYKIQGVLGEFEVVVVGDKAVDQEFGSGAVKVTPSHSFTDYEIAQRHNVPGKKVIDEDGKMMDNCGKYAGMLTVEAREAIHKDMEKMGLIDHVDEDYDLNLSICYRCGTTVEPLPSLQWFVDVNKKFKIKSPKLKGIKDGQEVTLKELANQVVKSGEIRIIPERFNKTYFNWMENLRDWCISRQIWWGHRIPVWYPSASSGKAGDEVKVQAESPGEGWKQDPDTLDTWFSSGLWTFSTLGWPEKTKELEYFHPTSVMETGYDIIFFWVARMILMSTYGLGEIPFETVYLHGLIRTRDGSKMSKSKPETMIDPLDMIEQYGADALRLSLIIGTTPGNDVKLYEEKIAGFRNFVNKLWNVARYLDSKGVELNVSKLETKSLADAWILSKLNRLIQEVSADLDKYSLSEAGQKLYDFLWNDFADWYVEATKVNPNDSVLAYVFGTLLKLLHPFVPFVTEQIWEELGKENKLIINEWPACEEAMLDTQREKSFENIKNLIVQIRQTRSDYKIEPAKKLKLFFRQEDEESLGKDQLELIKFLARLEEIEFVSEKPDKQTITLIVSDLEAYLPLGDVLDLGKEQKRLEGDMVNLENYLKGLESKLSNAGFLKKAPAELVETEKKKQAEGKEKLAKLQAQLDALQG